MKRLLILFGLAFAIGCDHGLGPAVQDRSPRPARLHLNIAFSDKSEHVEVLAWLETGVDELGQPRALPKDSLLVMGMPIAIVPRNSSNLWYEGRIPIAVEQFAQTRLTIKAPTVPGVVPAYPMDAWRIVGRAGPQRITTRRGDDVVLPVVHPGEPSSPIPEEQTWIFSAHSDGVQLVQFRGKGELPRELRLPGSFLARTSGSSLTAFLTTFDSRSDRSLSEGDYLITPVVDTRLSWVINLVD
jgi:hypothetical protein